MCGVDEICLQINDMYGEGAWVQKVADEASTWSEMRCPDGFVWLKVLWRIDEYGQ